MRGYILLILGQYVVVLTAVDDARAAVSARDWGELASSGIFIPRQRENLEFKTQSFGKSNIGWCSSSIIHILPWF